MKNNQGHNPGKWILLIHQAFAGLPPCSSKKKIKMFSQAGYNLDMPPNPFICCQNNHMLTFFFFQSLQKKPQKDKKECQWCELHQGNTTSLGWHTQQHLKGPRHRDVSAADVPSLTTSRSSQKNLSQLQRAGLWGHQVDPSRRMKGKAPALRAGTSPIFPAPHSWRKLKLHRKRSSVSFY